jgi:polysaccharide biosynthesis/export protein
MASTTSKLRFAQWLVLLLCALASNNPCAQEVNHPDQTASASSVPVTGTESVGINTSAGEASESFVIGANDVLSVDVWKEPEISRAVPVRSDGRISLPLVGEVQASGRTPRQLEQEIATKLRDYISEPEVTVIVQEIKSQRFNVLGNVAKPGSYLLTNSMTVLDAIAVAGGFRDFAKQKSIYILRHNSDGRESRVAFNYKDVIKGKNSSQNVILEPRDTIVVP